MKERPILFSAPMVRALLAGTKTQTRRVVKITHRTPGLAACLAPPAGMRTRTSLAAELCPYGHPGDRLWVRETFARIDGQTRPWIETDYQATYTHGDRLGDTLGIKKRWTPSIHMPRHASRITLEITSVRVERLQEISEADAQAEGWTRRPEVSTDPQVHKEAARDWFMDLWESINGPGSWDANPWVWVIEFRRLA